jgi:hypothetical protein
MVESSLQSLPLDEISFNEKIPRVMGKSYLEVVPHACDFAMFPSAVNSAGYS